MKRILAIFLLTSAFWLLAYGQYSGYKYSTPQQPAATASFNYYVSTTGNDSSSGTLASPWRTLTNAQTQLRSLIPTMATNLNVHVIGDYPVTNTLYLTAGDSGYNGFRVKWSGSLTAGTTITNWTVISTNNGNVMWSASYSGAKVRSLWVNGQRATRSHSYGGLGLTLTSTGYTGASGFLSNEPNPTGVEAFYNVFIFSESSSPVTGISGGTVTMLKNSHDIITKMGWASTNYDWVNVYGYFTNNNLQGSFYPNPSGTNIFYIARAFENMSNATTIVPNGLDTAVSVVGATNIDLGLSVQFTTYSGYFTNGFPSIAQAYIYYDGVDTNQVFLDGFYGMSVIRPAIYIAASTGCYVTNSTIQHVDNIGIHLTLASSGCKILGNTITDFGYNGIVLGQVGEGTNASVSTNCLISQNYVTSGGLLANGAVGIQSPFFTMSSIDHNTVLEIPYIGIAAGIGLDLHTNWQSYMGGNSIGSNLVVNTMIRLKDGAAIYSQAPNDGLSIKGNVVSRTDRSSTFQNVNAIYLDQGSRGVTLDQNVMDGTYTTFAFNLLQGSNSVLTNYSDNIRYYQNGIAPTTYNAPVLQSNPQASNPNIVATAGVTGSFTNSPSVTAWNTLIASYSPILWYRGNDLNTTSLDYSGNSYDGTYTGTYTQNQTSLFTGINRVVTSYNGTSGQINSGITTPINFDGTKPFTIISVATPNFDRSGFYGGVLAGNVQSTGVNPGMEKFTFFTDIYIVPTNSSVFGFQVIENSGTSTASKIGVTDLANGTPYLLISTYDGSRKSQGINLYVNGLYEPFNANGNTLTGSTVSTEQLHVGSRADTAGNYFKGKIGDVIILPFEATAEQVRATYRSATAP
jgi:hypothetical protein